MTVDFRDELRASPAAGIEPHLVGQQALWAGMQDLTKDDLESAEATLERLGEAAVRLPQARSTTPAARTS